MKGWSRDLIWPLSLCVCHCRWKWGKFPMGRDGNFSSFLSKINTRYFCNCPANLFVLHKSVHLSDSTFTFSGDAWQLLRERWCEISGIQDLEVTEITSIKILHGFPALQHAYCISVDGLFYYLSLYFTANHCSHSSENCALINSEAPSLC